MLFFRISRFIILIGGMAFTCGCFMVGPNYHTPSAPITEDWDVGDSDTINHRPASYCHWWEVFNDPVLNDLIQSAYDQNLTLLIAGLRVLEARAQLGVVVGNFYPQLQQITADFSNIRNPHPPPDKYINELTVGFDTAWELDLWGKYRRGIQASGANLLANIANYDDVMVALTAEVARTYVLIRSFEERIRLARKNAKIQSRALELTRILYEGGTESELDAQQAATVLYSTEALIPRLQTSLNQTTNALSVLLDIPSYEIKEILDAPGAIPQAPVEVAIGVPADLLRRRPDIRQAEFQALAQCAVIGIAKSELYPSFSLVGSLGWTASDAGMRSLSNPFRSSNYEYEFGPSFTWNIFNYGRLKNQVRVEDAFFEQLLANYRNVVLVAVSEVQDAAVAFLRSQDEAHYLYKSVETAQRSLEISLAQYKEGLATYQRVLDSTRALTNQQDQYVQAAADIITNLIAMYKALGGGWETRCEMDFVPTPVKCKMRKRTDWGRLLIGNDEECTGCKSVRNPVRAPDW